MIDPKMLKVGNAYSFKDKGMTEPALVVIERIDGGVVTAREKDAETARTWAIGTFIQNANEMATIIVPLGDG